MSEQVSLATSTTMYLEAVEQLHQLLRDLRDGLEDRRRVDASGREDLLTLYRAELIVGELLTEHFQRTARESK